MKQLGQDLKEYIEKAIGKNGEGSPCCAVENGFTCFYLPEDAFEKGYSLITTFFLRNGFSLTERSASDHSGPGEIFFIAVKRNESCRIVFEYKSHSFTITVI
jgi:hypothetical protein